MQSLHYVLGTFAGIVWRDNGIREVCVGPLLALGAAAEVTAMFLFKRIAGRFGARHLIAFAMLVSAVRWAVMTLQSAALAAGAAATDPRHHLRDLSYLGLMNFIANWTPEDVAAEAQSFATVVQLSVVVSPSARSATWSTGSAFSRFRRGVVSSLWRRGWFFWSLRAMPAAETPTKPARQLDAKGSTRVARSSSTRVQDKSGRFSKSGRRFAVRKRDKQLDRLFHVSLKRR